jgi:FkbM family methyltransferase
MTLRNHLLQAVLEPVKQVQHKMYLLRRCVKNSAKAFHPCELGYHLCIGRFGDFELAYRKGTADEDVIQQSFENDIFFPSIPEYSPDPDHIIIDVGAHIGTFSLLAASKVPKGKVFAIEASQETCDLLKINTAMNRAQNVEVCHLALSGERGRTLLHHNVGNWGHSIMKPLSNRGEEVITDTLAGFMETKKIQRCNFVKFNCEGAEFPILCSTPPEVLNRIDWILILYHCDLAEGYSLESLVQHLRRSGFNLRFLNQTEQRGWIVGYRTGTGSFHCECPSWPKP